MTNDYRITPVWAKSAICYGLATHIVFGLVRFIVDASGFLHTPKGMWYGVTQVCVCAASKFIFSFEFAAIGIVVNVDLLLKSKRANYVYIYINKILI